MGFKDVLSRIKKLFLRFWRSDNTKISILRDVFVAFLMVFIILMALWTYTGQWFGAPMVAIESGSMMHPNEPFARIGTIDAGDMVLLVKVYTRHDVTTYVSSNDYQYGKKGDVIVYRPYGNENLDQIIHRAMCWVDVDYEGSNKTYTIEELDVYDHDASDPIYLPEVGIVNTVKGGGVVLNWSHSGFITKGDNPYTNSYCDQVGGICDEPIKIQWVSGKARGEIPWVGTINLLFNDIIGGKDTVKNVPQDSIICLILLIGFLVSIPITLDIISYYKDKKKGKTKQNKSPAKKEEELQNNINSKTPKEKKGLKQKLKNIFKFK
jgi:signal peptidase